jgi:hypothetical protein
MRECRGFKLLPSAEVVKWQTRTFEGRVAQAVRVQVPPSAPNLTFFVSRTHYEQARARWRWSVLPLYLPVLVSLLELPMIPFGSRLLMAFHSTLVPSQ